MRLAARAVPISRTEIRGLVVRRRASPAFGLQSLAASASSARGIIVTIALGAHPVAGAEVWGKDGGSSNPGCESSSGKGNGKGNGKGRRKLALLVDAGQG